MANLDTRPFAVLTGASSGVGYELASPFSEAGYDLAVAVAAKMQGQISQPGSTS